MFDFIKIQYQLGNISSDVVEKYAVLGWITKDQAKLIVEG